MAIVNITIDTEHLGDTPKVQIDGHDIKVLSHIDFDWTNSQFPLLPSTSKLTIKRSPDYMYGHNTLDDSNDHANEAVIKDITWKTESHE